MNEAIGRQPAVHYQTGRFPPEERLNWATLAPVIGPAAAALARYDEMLAAAPNQIVLFASLTLQEAVLSSRIEGIRATLSEVLQFEAGCAPESRVLGDDIHEVLNYRAALSLAEERLQTLPLCLRVLREAHEVLLRGARGLGKSPGEYRRIPNWIGPPGCSIETARYVPIEANRLPEAMSTWERHIHADAPDRLVQLGILHAEFEALHPFLDGNGRLGRLLVPLFLWQCGLIQTPRFYISAFFESRRDAYYDGLLAVSRDDDWTGWCRFFLDAVRTQAEDNLKKARKIVDLYDEMKSRVADLTRSRQAVRALDAIFERPIFGAVGFATHSGIPPRSAWRMLDTLRQGGILTALAEGRGRRTTVLAFPALLNIAEGEDVF